MDVPIDEAREELTARLMSLRRGVVGVTEGECDGRPCLRVLVVALTKSLRATIPAACRGYPVVVDEIGPIRGPRPPQ